MDIIRVNLKFDLGRDSKLYRRIADRLTDVKDRDRAHVLRRLVELGLDAEEAKTGGQSGRGRDSEAGPHRSPSVTPHGGAEVSAMSAAPATATEGGDAGASIGEKMRQLDGVNIEF